MNVQDVIKWLFNTVVACYLLFLDGFDQLLSIFARSNLKQRPAVEKYPQKNPMHNAKELTHSKLVIYFK